MEAEKGIFERGTVSRGHASYSIARFAWGLAILRMPIAIQKALCADPPMALIRVLARPRYASPAPSAPPRARARKICDDRAVILSCQVLRADPPVQPTAHMTIASVAYCTQCSCTVTIAMCFSFCAIASAIPFLTHTLSIERRVN